MAIEVAVYAEFQMDNGEQCRIEKTEKGYFHIHLGNTLFVFTPREFEEFASAVIEGRDKLTELKSND